MQMSSKDGHEVRDYWSAFLFFSHQDQGAGNQPQKNKII